MKKTVVITNYAQTLTVNYRHYNNKKIYVTTNMNKRPYSVDNVEEKLTA
jgi:hypothetical protein